MRRTRAFTLAAAAAAMAAAGPVWAHGRAHHHHHRHGGHLHFGIRIGPPVVRHLVPYHWHPHHVTVVPAAPVYIERSAEEARERENDWYYCRESDAYYPYVKHCPGGWERVPPRPQG